MEKDFGGPANTHSKISKFYKLLESTAALLFKKKKALEEEDEIENEVKEQHPKNKIQKQVRKLMRRKAKLSQESSIKLMV